MPKTDEMFLANVAVLQRSNEGQNNPQKSRKILV